MKPLLKWRRPFLNANQNANLKANLIAKSIAIIINATVIKSTKLLQAALTRKRQLCKKRSIKRRKMTNSEHANVKTRSLPPIIR